MASPRGVALVAMVVMIPALISAGPAFGTFTTAPSPPAMQAATASLAAPASTSAVNGACVPGVSRAVTVSWAITGSTFADGYLVRRATAAGGPYSTIATITARTTIVHSDTTVAASTTYHYRVQATKLAWRSADSPTASVTTPSALCV